MQRMTPYRLCLAVLLIGLAAAFVCKPKVHWFNEDAVTAYKQEEADFRAKYGPGPIAPLLPAMQVYGQMLDGTNLVNIEFGFRDDGVVVWRKVKEK